MSHHSSLPAASVYELLRDYAAQPDPIRELIIGPVWTWCQTDKGIGLAMSPQTVLRTLSWPGTLCGRAVGEVAGWLSSWEPYAATVGMAATNAALADLKPAPTGESLKPGTLWPPNLAVFEHFLPRIADKNVVVVGRYPGLEALATHCRLSVLERQVQGGDYPDPAAEFLLPEAEWVFLTASSITNKTFPRLAELAASAQTVLMGPTVPWLPEWADYGIDYLAGVEVVEPLRLKQTISEGGGVRIFEGGVGYRVVNLTAELQNDWLRQRIAEVYAEKQELTLSMERWYATHTHRFPEYERLDGANRRLSCLDTAFKRRVP